MKRRFSVTLLLAFLLAALWCARALAESEQGFTYTVADDKATITKFDANKLGEDGKLTIPDRLGGYSVTSIGISAFASCTSLTSVTIPNSVTSIGRSAFSSCTSLTSVTIPDSVTSIELATFRKCTKLESVTIPNSVTSIAPTAFYNCTSLTSVTIPNSVTSIGLSAFSYCESLESVTIGSGVTSITQTAFYNCTSLTSVTIPNSVTSIGQGAFQLCTSLTSVTIPDSVTSIGQGAFLGCAKLESVTIGSGVTSIAQTAFYNCTSLTSVTISDSVTSIEVGAFRSCPTAMNIWYSGTEAGWSALGNNKPSGTLHAIAAAGEGTAEEPYTITKADHWDTLAGFVADSTLDTAGKHFRLNESISVSTMLGASGHPFSGIYDGNGKTLNVSISGTDEFMAPFSNISGATIKNLKVKGTVSGGMHASGLVGVVRGGGNRIENCVVSVDVTTTGRNCGGFLGHGNIYDTTISSCVFAGSLYGDNLRAAGTIWGWSEASAKAIVEYCLDASDSTFPIGRSNGNLTTSSSVTNTYYTAGNKTAATESPWKNAGKQAYTVTSGEDVNIVIMGAPGILWENRVYAAQDEDVCLMITGGSEVEGTTKEYAGSAGTMTRVGDAYTLTMPGTDVLIAVQNMVYEVPYTEGTADCALVLANESTWVSGWYVVRDDTSVQDRINLYGTVNLILPDGKTLIAEKGIHVPEGSSLIVWTQEAGTGALSVTGPDKNFAGIGGNNDESCGMVTINGGIVKVRSGESAAAIDAGTLSIPATHWVISRDDENALPVPSDERVASCHGGYAWIQICGHSYIKSAETYVCEWCGSETDRLPTFGGVDFALPGDLSKIGDYAFEGIALGIVEIPETCRSIGKGAFRNSSLRQIRIPTGCSVAEDAFEGCTGAVVYGPADAVKVSAAHGSCMFVEDGQ